jgi:flagellar basal-body rod protein FlgG
MELCRRTNTVVSIAFLVSVVGHYAVYRHFEAKVLSLVECSRTDGRVDGTELMLPRPLEDCPPEIPRFLSEVDPIQIVQQLLEEPNSKSSLLAQSSSQAVPNPLEPATPSETPPLIDQAKTDAGTPDTHAVRRVIEEELAGSSGEEKEIWYDEMKSLPAGVVRDLLQVRKQLRALPRALHQADAPLKKVAPFVMRKAEIPAESVSQMRRQQFTDWTSTTFALEQAITLSRHNIANGLTPGYKQIRRQFVDAYQTPEENVGRSSGGTLDESGFHSQATDVQADGCRLTLPVLDVRQGILLKTGRALDLAIEGHGFFAVVADGQRLWTRCGSLTIDSQRRLTLSVDGSMVLQPPIVIPEDTQEIQISAQGEVLVLRFPQNDPQLLGRLILARFACPERLRPVGKTLLNATSDSGVADIGPAEVGGRGAIHQGFVEQSNVDVKSELADIERIESLLNSLPTQTRPVTASGAANDSR